MNSLKLVALADVPAQPWRNGGGVTHELLAWTPGHGAGTPADWVLRVSVATIAADGPFSAFAGVRRWFAVIEGDGVSLRSPRGETLCTRDGKPHAFDGADAPMCTLLGGPTRDLNLMLRAGNGRGAMRRVAKTSALATMFAGRRWRGLFCAGATTLAAGPSEFTVPPMTLVWSERPDSVWTCRPTDAAWWLTLDDA